MARLIDLGVQSFRDTHPGGQCLLLNAAATLEYEGDSSGVELAAGPPFNPIDTWITMQRELPVDIYIESFWDSPTALPDLIKLVIDTVRISAQVSCAARLQLSMLSHDYHTLAGSMVVHVHIIFCKVPDSSPPRRPGKLPGRARGIAVDPYPPRGIAKAVLKRVTLKMRGLKHCAPWNMDLTKLWLEDSSCKRLLESSDESLVVFEQHAYETSLRPLHSPSLPMPYKVPTEDRCLLYYSSFTNENSSSLHQQCESLNTVLHCAIQSLFVELAWPYKGKVDRVALDDAPRLFDIAPALFKPHHYENIRQRAGLLPVVVRSMAMLFQTSFSPRVKQKVASVEIHLESRYEIPASAFHKGRASCLRPLIRCVMWTSLQRSAYKTRGPKESMLESNFMTMSSDYSPLMEGLTPNHDLAEDMMSSDESSMSEFGDILSDEDDENEQVSACFSHQLMSSESCPLSDEDCLDYESQADHCVSDLISHSGTGTREITLQSFSLPSGPLSDMLMENEVREETLFPLDFSSQGDACEDIHDTCMIDFPSTKEIKENVQATFP